MHINLFLIPFIIVSGLIFGQNDNRRNRLRYILLSSIVLILIASLRSPEWMTYNYRIDTLDYENTFLITMDLQWDEIWSRFRERYVLRLEEYDIGFIVLIKIIGLFTDNFQVFSLLVDLLFFVPLGIILYRYCTSMVQITFAFVFYIALVQIFLFGGARQIFAIGFDMMALLALIDKKKLLSIVFFLIGVTIHFSSFLFLIPLLMIWRMASPLFLKWIHFICFLFFPIVMLMPNQVVYFMGTLFGMVKYSAYGEGEIRSGGGTFIFLIEMLSLLFLIAITKRNLVENKVMTFFYTMIPMFTLTSPLIKANGAMIRVTLYYYLFLMVLIPFGIECMFKKGPNRKIAYFVMLLTLSLFVISNGGIVYYFYWQFR